MHIRRMPPEPLDHPAPPPAPAELPSSPPPSELPVSQPSELPPSPGQPELPGAPPPELPVAPPSDKPPAPDATPKAARPPEFTASGRRIAPRQDCENVHGCFSDAAGIGHLCGYGPICGTCVVYKPLDISRGLLRGTCRIRSDRGEFPCTAPICDAFVPRQGALDAKGRSSAGGSAVALTLAKAAQKVGGQSVRREPRPVAPVVLRQPADSQTDAQRDSQTESIEEFEMNRQELKALIREAMDEERGGGPAELAAKWEGGTVLLQPQDPALQAKELPIDALLHKVVMVRDKLRVLEQKLNAHPKLSDAEKVDLQAYITGCYGSLTTFNVLFRDRADGFIGAGGKDK